MNLVNFVANVDFSQWSLSIPGIPVERSDKTGMAMLFERYLLRANTASSAATEIRKNIGVENRPERESYQVHSLTNQ